MKFAEWLKKIEEASTDTGNVAHFARPIGIGMSRRMYPKPITMQVGNTKLKDGKNLQKL
jgi:hypothetical protein